MCGNGWEGKGCSTGHVGHEYFCREALAPTISTEPETTWKADARMDNLLLQVMKIPQWDGKIGHESVLWDTACSGMFVKMEHVNQMNFPCREKRLHVKTLGGEEKDIEGKVYDC